MGPAKSLVDRLDNSKELEQAAKEAINTSILLIDKRFDIFQNQMNLPIGKINKIPSKYLITYCKKIGVSIIQNSYYIDYEISSIVGSFCKGEIGKGI